MHGKNFIGNSLSADSDKYSQLVDINSGKYLDGKFYHASKRELEAIFSLSQEAFILYKNISQKRRADFLDTIADEIYNLGDVLVERTMSESNLPRARIEGERARTINQIKMFSELLKEGSWVEATIDTALPEREPLPRNDLRKMLRPLGVVGIFEASNFPLAFGCAGGDTASALAAGCPIILKAHSAHSGTSELIATAIITAVKKCNMPNGVFSLVHGGGREVGQEIVKAENVKAIGFTGSTQAGMKLFEIANQRKNPIPVFAEMGSINPCVFLPSAFKNSKTLASLYASSISLGVGQFCTNPGLIIAFKNKELEQFEEDLKEEIRNIIPSNMLTNGIFEAYENNKQNALLQKGVSLLATTNQEISQAKGNSTIALCGAKDFTNNKSLQEEIFGPYSLIVECENQEEMREVVNCLNGQLTATIMANDEEITPYIDIVRSLEDKCGRLLFNSVPTGVEVCHSMQHGGPSPASTDSRFTSVGTGAIKRFSRPVCFQDCPTPYLPNELKDENENNILRVVNGLYERGSL